MGLVVGLLLCLVILSVLRFGCSVWHFDWVCFVCVLFVVWLCAGIVVFGIGRVFFGTLILVHGGLLLCFEDCFCFFEELGFVRFFLCLWENVVLTMSICVLIGSVFSLLSFRLFVFFCVFLFFLFFFCGVLVMCVFFRFFVGGFGLLVVRSVLFFVWLYFLT